MDRECVRLPLVRAHLCMDCHEILCGGFDIKTYKIVIDHHMTFHKDPSFLTDRHLTDSLNVQSLLDRTDI